MAEGEGFEPSERETPLSGLANRRTRPTMRPFRNVRLRAMELSLPTCCWLAAPGAKGGTRTPMPLRAQRPERCVSTDFTTLAGSYVCHRPSPRGDEQRHTTILRYALRACQANQPNANRFSHLLLAPQLALRSRLLAASLDDAPPRSSPATTAATPLAGSSKNRGLRKSKETTTVMP